MLVAVLGAATASWSGAGPASNALVAATQQRLTETIAGRVRAMSRVRRNRAGSGPSSPSVSIDARTTMVPRRDEPRIALFRLAI
ncbi:hypothetical protein AB0K60_25465 [Thermopolyspora sp. NPDC052614]|uniref:hypothetical protein n=1 Tax=Thermopolyspora sp. NPDC052614 TaxID=3155682 RepID=UPI0034479A7E